MFDRILAGSRLYILADRMLGAVCRAGRESGIYGLAAFIMGRFRLRAGDSAVVRGAAGAADLFGGKMRESFLANRFLRLEEKSDWSKGSIFGRAYERIVGVLSGLFRTARLDRLLPGSIFLKPQIWCGLTVLFLPLLPTMAVLALVLMGYLSLLAKKLMDAEKRLRYFSINKYVYLYGLTYGAAALLSVDWRSSLKIGVMTLCFILFFIVFINSITTKKQLQNVVTGMIFAGTAVSLYGFYQFVFPDRFASAWLDESMFSDIGLRVYSTLANPNVLGEYFLLVIPFSAALFMTAKKRVTKAFFAISTCIMLVCLVLTYSRGSYLGLLFAVAIFLVLLDRRFIVPGIVALCVVVLIMPESVLGRVLSIGNMGDSSTSYRVYIWMGTLAMLKEYWFSGIGPGEAAFNRVYPVYAYSSVAAPHAHNLFLQIICDTGAVGLLLFAAILYQYYKNTFAALRRKEAGDGRMYTIAGISAVTGFMVQSMTDYTFYNYRVMLLFWVVLGISILSTGYARLEGETV